MAAATRAAPAIAKRPYPASPIIPSVAQDRVEQDGIILPVPVVVGEEVAEARSGLQDCAGQAEDEILGRPRPVDRGGGDVPADIAPDRALDAQRLQYVGTVEPEVVDVAGDTEFRRKVEIGAHAKQH